MRIVFVSAYYPPYAVGGAERSTFALAEALSQRGHRVAIVAPRLGPLAPEGDVAVETVDVGIALSEPGKALRPRVFDRIGLQRRISRAVARLARDADLVHCQSLSLLPAAYVAARRARVTIVATIRDVSGVCPIGVCLLHGPRVPHDCGLLKLQLECVPEYVARYDVGSRARNSLSALALFATARIRSRLLRRCDAVYSVGSDLGAVYASAGLLDAEQVEVLPNIADLEEAAPPAANGRPYAIFAGRVTPGKGVEYLLDATASVVGAAPDFKLVVAGHADAQWQERLERAGGIDYWGSVDRSSLAAAYAGARFAVVPSIWPEPFPRAVLEAAFAGAPVVATRAGGIPDAVDDGATGLLVEPRDSAALADAMLALWRDPSRAAAMGRAASELVRARFSAGTIAARAERLYRAAVDRQ